MVDKKLLSIQNHEQIKEINNCLKEIGDVDSKDTLEENMKFLMKIKDEEQQNMEIIKNGIKLTNPEIESEEEFVKNILDK